MTTDQCIQIWGAAGNSIAGVGAAVAAVIMARQAWVQRRLDRERNEWLRAMIFALRNGQRLIPDKDLPMALYWIHQGVLDVYPPSAYPDKFFIRYRTEG